MIKALVKVKQDKNRKRARESEMSQYLAFVRERNALAQLTPKNKTEESYKRSRLAYLDRMIAIYRKKIFGKNYLRPR